MIGPSSQISKILLALLLIVLIFYIFMDINLYLRIQNYPIDRFTGENITSKYNGSWIGCDISPLCDVTVKGLLLDHTNHYLFSPLATIADLIFEISQTPWITPNKISTFHVFVALLSAKCVASDTLSVRRVGVVLFQVRTFLDDLDGHVARVRKHVKGERSEIGTSGYYIDGICDFFGCVALMAGVFVFLKNNPPRRGYLQLHAILPSKESTGGVIYKAKVTTKKVARKICCFSAQLMISSTLWNRYIALYQDMLERNNVTKAQFTRQNLVFKSRLFFAVAWLWRIVNLHNMIHVLLVAIFCDKLWEFLRAVQYIGFVVLICVICVSEIHVLEVENYIFNNLVGNITSI